MSTALATRRAGVLLHPTSLPGSGGNGTLGAEARRFVDFARAGGFSVWQVLPVGPADAYGSPYTLRSAYAGDPRLIDRADLGSFDALPGALEFDAAPEHRVEVYRSFAGAATSGQVRKFADFVRRERRWLTPYGLFEAAAAKYGGEPWWSWPAAIKDRGPSLRALWVEERDRFRAALFEQYLFDLQWSALKRYANERGLHLFGDLPFYVDANSVEVWWDRQLFRLDAAGRPTAVAGVPPDYFNADGQRWGNPLYDWQRMAERGFDWWLTRLAGQLARFDLVRIDHFRALESYWEVPAGAPTAREGVWRHGAGDALLGALQARLGELPLVAEDLGIITDEVRALRDRYALPGMVVLQFGFDGMPDNPHLPANHIERSVVYTGTHDNDTTVGWYRKLDDGARALVRRLSGVGDDAPVPDFLIDAAYASRSRLAVIPLQDLLGLDSDARMNTPGSTEGNWRWRFDWSQIGPNVTARSLELATRHTRLG